MNDGNGDWGFLHIFWNEDFDNKWNEDFCTFLCNWEYDKIVVKNDRMIKSQTKVNMTNKRVIWEFIHVL